MARGDVERLLRCWGIRVGEAGRSPRQGPWVGSGQTSAGRSLSARGRRDSSTERCASGAARAERPTAVRRAAHEMARQLAAAGITLEGFDVQRMARPETTELIVGAVRDPRSARCWPVAPPGSRSSCSATSRSGSAARPAGSRRHAPRPQDVPVARWCRGRPRADLGSLQGPVMRVRALIDAHPPSQAPPQSGHRHARGRASSTLASGSTPRAPPRRSPHSTPERCRGPRRHSAAQAAPGAVQAPAPRWSGSACVHGSDPPRARRP